MENKDTVNPCVIPVQCFSKIFLTLQVLRNLFFRSFVCKVSYLAKDTLQTVEQNAAIFLPKKQRSVSLRIILRISRENLLSEGKLHEVQVL